MKYLWIISVLVACLMGNQPVAHATQSVKASNRLESPLYSSIKAQKAYLKTDWDEKYSSRQFFIVLGTGSENTIFAVVQLVELAPNYFFNETYQLQNVRNLYPIFRNSKDISANLKLGKYGSYDFAVFKNEGNECVTFVNETGDSASDFGVSEGTQRILGYYCATDHNSLSEKNIHMFFNTIGTKAKGESPPAETVSISDLEN